MGNLRHHIPAFMASAQRTWDDGFKEPACTIVFVGFYALFSAEAWEIADAVIASRNPTTMPPELAYAVLMSTLRQKEHLPSRVIFFRDCVSLGLIQGGMGGLE